MGVDLGGVERGVAEEFLNQAKIGSPFEKVGRKGMAELMGMEAIVNPVFFGLP
jgi:hypothetical protein